MLSLDNFAIIVFLLQTAHSVEELSTGFHKKWYLFKMPFVAFLTFEIMFELFWGAVVFFHAFPFREHLLLFFFALMFANGIQHIVWAGVTKKYVPGLITAPFHVVLFLVIYYTLISLP